MSKYTECAVKNHMTEVLINFVLCVQLMTVNSVVFTVKAVDADGDMITYTIDHSSVRCSTDCPHTSVHVFYVCLNSPMTCYL